MPLSELAPQLSIFRLRKSNRLKAEYLIPVVISLTVFSVVGYFLYQKYKPTIGALNAGNTVLGDIEAPFIGIESWLQNEFGSNNGNGSNGTPSMTLY